MGVFNKILDVMHLNDDEFDDEEFEDDEEFDDGIDDDELLKLYEELTE